MNSKNASLRQTCSQLTDIEKSLFPRLFNMDKKEVIDYAFTRCSFNPVSFADLGGVWGIEGAYTFYTLDRYDIQSAHLVDTDFTPTVSQRAQEYPNLVTTRANFGDFPVISNAIQSTDVLFLFDVLLHQVKPDWNEILSFYAERTTIFVILNQQFTGSDTTVRLLDLGFDGYFDNVPHDSTHPTYKALFENMYEMHPQHNRIWRDIHNVWQWGIVDKDLIAVIENLGFTLRFYKNCGPFGILKNFENHAFVFEKKTGKKMYG